MRWGKNVSELGLTNVEALLRIAQGYVGTLYEERIATDIKKAVDSDQQRRVSALEYKLLEGKLSGNIRKIWSCTGTCLLTSANWKLQKRYSNSCINELFMNESCAPVSYRVTVGQMEYGRRAC